VREVLDPHAAHLDRPLGRGDGLGEEGAALAAALDEVERDLRKPVGEDDAGESGPAPEIDPAAHRLQEVEGGLAVLVVRLQRTRSHEVHRVPPPLEERLVMIEQPAHGASSPGGRYREGGAAALEPGAGRCSTWNTGRTKRRQPDESWPRGTSSPRRSGDGPGPARGSTAAPAQITSPPDPDEAER